MSNKMDATDMKQEKKRELKPHLRFPEFQDSPEWSKKPLEDVLSPIVRQRKKPINPYIGLGVRSHGKGTFLKNLEIPEKNSMEYLYEVQRDDLIVNITFAWEGAIAIVQQTDAGALVSHRFPTYTFKRNAAIPEFFQYIILDKLFIYKLGVISPGGAGRNRVLNRNDFLKLTTFLPDIDEQKKIAACLISLDEQIDAQSQKLDALNAHKKGLLQQLFPAEGETLPQLRFPEFQDAPEWEEKKLGSLVAIFSGDAPNSHKLNSTHGCPYVKVEDMNNCSKYQRVSREYAENSPKSLPIGSILFPKRGAAIMGNKVRIAAVSFYIDSNMMALFPLKTSSLSPEFLYYLIFTQQLSKIADTSSIPQINNKHIIAYKVATPSLPEQQRIADCLSSIDELIAAQSQKLDALKAHKKGLMQQLFPSLAEVRG